MTTVSCESYSVFNLLRDSVLFYKTFMHDVADPL